MRMTTKIQIVMLLPCKKKRANSQSMLVFCPFRFKRLLVS